MACPRGPDLGENRPTAIRGMTARHACDNLSLTRPASPASPPTGCASAPKTCRSRQRCPTGRARPPGRGPHQPNPGRDTRVGPAAQRLRSPLRSAQPISDPSPAAAPACSAPARRARAGTGAHAARPARGPRSGPGALTIEEVAAVLRVKVTTIRWLRQEGRFIPAAKVGRRLVWSMTDVQAWALAQREDVAA